MEYRQIPRLPRDAVMSHELICAWLELPTLSWPPDHYTLLGVEPGETDVQRIEQRAHDRFERLRRYQLTHPDQVTEAMNRVAQALVCLSDTAARLAYDAALAAEGHDTLPAPPGAATNQERSELALPVAVPLDGPAPLPDAVPVPDSELPVALPASEGPSTPVALPVQENPEASPDLPVAVPVDVPVAEPADPALEAARASPSARRGLGTRRGLYQRIARTRQLLWAWEQAGKCLNDPQRRLARRSEAIELVRQLSTVRLLLQDFPPLLGQAGQPGYLVVALARQQLIAHTFQNLLSSQREALARDWRSGRALLATHRQFLRQELRSLRRKGFLGRCLRTTRAFIADYPEFWLVILALAAIHLAFQSVMASWVRLGLVVVQGGLLVTLGFLVIRKLLMPRRDWLHRPRAAAPRPRSGKGKPPAAPRTRVPV